MDEENDEFIEENKTIDEPIESESIDEPTENLDNSISSDLSEEIEEPKYQRQPNRYEKAFTKINGDRNFYEKKQKELDKKYNEVKKERQNNFKKKKNADPNIHKTDGSDMEKKGIKDKARDLINQGSAAKDVITNRANAIKTNVNNFLHPVEATKAAGKAKVKNAVISFIMKKPYAIAVVVGLILLIVIIALILFIVVLDSEHEYGDTDPSALCNFNNTDADGYWWPVGSNATEVNGVMMATGTPLPTRISSEFGPRNTGIEGASTNHGGVDIANTEFTQDYPIIATADGVIEFAGTLGGYGEFVKINHGDNIYSAYGHMATGSIIVSEGESVEAGQVIGIMGTTGISGGIHLHFEIYQGGAASTNRVDPLNYISQTNPRPTTSTLAYVNSTDNLWWPIGSCELDSSSNNFYTNINVGPVQTWTNDYDFDQVRQYSSGPGIHGALDIQPSSHDCSDVPIIATSGGTVIEVVDYITANKKDDASVSAYGNEVTIDHGNGLYSVYAHLKYEKVDGTPGVIVEVGDTVTTGQVIGFMGNTGNSSATHLHFELRDGANSFSNVIDPELYISPTEPTPGNITSQTSVSSQPDYCNVSDDGYNIFEPMLTKTEFVQKMNEFSSKLYEPKASNFEKNFVPYAEEIYEAAVKNNISPEFLIAKASIESANFISCGSYNYFGYAIPNNQSTCPSYMFDDFTDAIETVAGTINNYITPGTDSYDTIKGRMDLYKSGGCDPSGYGEVGSATWVMSLYGWFGHYLVGPSYSTSGTGGCYYIKAWVDMGYMPHTYTQSYYNDRCASNTCSSPSAAVSGCSPTTTCEKSDYNAYVVKSRFDQWDLFIS